MSDDDDDDDGDDDDDDDDDDNDDDDVLRSRHAMVKKTNQWIKRFCSVTVKILVGFTDCQSPLFHLQLLGSAIWEGELSTGLPIMYSCKTYTGQWSK